MTERSLPRNVRTPKSRTKTFTGCWTCRARRVKCDDEQPHCRRCRTSGWQCQGYGMRLGWSQTPGSRSHRRQLKPGAPQSTVDLSSAAVTALLAELDESSGDGSAQQRGPFSVFSASDCAVKDPEPSTGIDSRILSSPVNESRDEPGRIKFISGLPNSNTLIIPTSESEEGDKSPSEPIQDAFSHASLSPSPLTHGKSPSPVPPEHANGACYDTALAPCNSRRTIPDCDRDTKTQHNASLILYTLPLIGSLHPRQLPRPETELIHHWVVFMSGNMLLIDTPDNPCRTVFMPLALKGFEDPSTDSSIHHSIFHAICASSAFSLFHLRRDRQYQSIAMHHDQLALRHLRENLQRAKRLDEPTLAAVLTCITAEAMSGRRSRWRAHVAGGLGLLENEMHDGWIRSPTASRLLQSYISLSSLCNLPMSTQLMSLLDGPPELQHYLERSHGVTAPLIKFLTRIQALVDSGAVISTEELDRLEVQLYLNFPSLSAPDAHGSVIIQHALNSFYYASIIFFRRMLRHAALSEVQDIVEKAVQELEAVDTLTHNKKGGCAYNWASFVVAAECQKPDLQARMMACWDRKTRHGIQSITILSETLKALWHRREQAGPYRDIHWQEIAQEADFDFMLV
ncbi:hypothetical protein N7466_004639 [Penicillium verhagenii]|uniref:uncharacterized protein n=1 Tax=Penicillium verhagenii TaxID=1562060 RepID=UPI0025451E7F|nr:uncharacterized protein N7466_004639 [Penicillium verhagenii]KAJ5935092.1 hypothetical protein N7466_004639 [Penicillium verhagenii]